MAIFGKILDPLTFSAKNPPKQIAPAGQSVLGKEINNTGAKFQGLFLTNGVDIDTFVPKNVQKVGIVP